MKTSRTSLLLAGSLVASLVVALTATGASADASSRTSSHPAGNPASSEVRLDASRLGTRHGGPAARMTAKASSSSDTKVQRVTLKWKGTWKKPRYEKSAVVPGIGNITLVCKPSATMIRLYAADRTAETQMWMAKYEVKNDQNVVAVKTARIYRYAHAFDDGTGGTGSLAHEGLNQRSPIENYSSGYIDGIISQRPGRNQPAAGDALKPVTSFRLNWYWNGFHHPQAYRSCQFDAVFKTTFPTRLGVNWHGEADAQDNVRQVTQLPSIGELRLRCGTNDDGGGGIQSVSLAPNDPDARVYAETVTGEGLRDYHVDKLSLGYDPETGVVGPVPLPRNGMMRLYYTVGGVTRPFIVSSYYITNNGNAALNLCELAAAPY